MTTPNVGTWSCVDSPLRPSQTLNLTSLDWIDNTFLHVACYFGQSSGAYRPILAISTHSCDIGSWRFRSGPWLRCYNVSRTVAYLFRYATGTTWTGRARNKSVTRAKPRHSESTLWRPSSIEEQGLNMIILSWASVINGPWHFVLCWDSYRISTSELIFLVQPVQAITGFYGTGWPRKWSTLCYGNHDDNTSAHQCGHPTGRALTASYRMEIYSQCSQTTIG